MTYFETFQRNVARALIALSIIHVPFLMLICWLRGDEVLVQGLIAVALAALPAAFMALNRPIATIACAVAVALIGQTSMFVYAMSGHPWQVEMHFYYFAVLAMLSSFYNWRVLVVGASLIVIHHLSLNVLLPNAIYPGGTDFMRVAVHTLAVAIQTGMLIGIGYAIPQAFREVQTSRDAAEKAASELQRIFRARGEELTATTERADKTRHLLERFEQEMAASIELLHDAASGLQVNSHDLGAAAARASAQTVTVGLTSEETARKVKLAAHAGDELAHTITEVG
ncbi:MAG: hypothetical protein HY659_04285, partial [Rhizobiales bacterium]|nr:hypothetical protein [Hyphomicrobiales bacterium]